MKEYKDKICEEMDRCLVTDDEWKEMLQNKLTQKVQLDPFREAVFEEEKDYDSEQDGDKEEAGE